MSKLPADCIGVVAEFLATDATAAHQVAMVSSKWHAAFLDHEPLWALLMRQRWPMTSKKKMTHSVYRARVLADQGFSPLQPGQLSEIENCTFDFAFRCPMYAEALKTTDEVTKSGAPILFCEVCQQKVYTVLSKEELAEKRAEGRCVKFNRAMLDGSLIRSKIQVLVLLDDTVPLEAMHRLLSTAAAQNPFYGTEFSATFKPLEVAYQQTGDTSLLYSTLTLDNLRLQGANPKHQEFQEVLIPNGFDAKLLRSIPSVEKVCKMGTVIEVSYDKPESFPDRKSVV